MADLQGLAPVVPGVGQHIGRRGVLAVLREGGNGVPGVPTAATPASVASHVATGRGYA
jgi:hypothetical protein